MKKVESIIKAVEMFSDKEAFLFDMDGLIFDTERTFMEQLAVVMEERDYHLTREIYCETLGLGGEALREKMFSYYGREYPFYEISKEAGRRVKKISGTVGLSVKPEIREVLDYLKKNGKVCAVASSSRTETVEHHLNISGLRFFFQQIIGGEQVEKSKPAPDIFLLAARRLGKAGNQCVVLEDSENGVRAGLAAGCRVICVPDLKMPAIEVQKKVDILVLRSYS